MTTCILSNGWSINNEKHTRSVFHRLPPASRSALPTVEYGHSRWAVSGGSLSSQSGSVPVLELSDTIPALFLSLHWAALSPAATSRHRGISVLYCLCVLIKKESENLLSARLMEPRCGPHYGFSAFHIFSFFFFFLRFISVSYYLQKETWDSRTDCSL